MNSCLVKMTEDLHLIAGWCCSHQLLINPSKTELILLGARQLLSKVSDIRVPFLDQELTPVSSVKDLEITLDSYLNFNDHVNTLSLIPSRLAVLRELGLPSIKDQLLVRDTTQVYKIGLAPLYLSK